MNAQFEQVLLKSQVEVQEATFSTLAKELHDNIGQLLTSCRMLLGITIRGMKEVPDTLIVAETTVAKALDELRSLTKSLTKEWLERFDFIENLNIEIARMNTTHTFKLLAIHPERIFLENDKQIILFRIVQEALQNATRHGNAKNISISVTETPSHLSLQIKDDGEGFNSNDNLNGLGILNMKQRTELLKGKINWSTSKGNGCSVNIELPINIKA